MESRHAEADDIGFFETILGLLTAPGQTTELLFETHRPPHVLLLFFALLVSIFGPVVWHVGKFGFVVYRAEVLFALLFVFAFTLLFFIFCEALFLRMFGVIARLDEVVAIVVYSAVPIILFFWLLYGANFYYHGTVSLVEFLMKGYVPTNDTFTKVVPIALAVSHLSAILVFCHAIRAVGDMYGFTALLVAVLSLLPLYVALILGLSIAEIAIPGAFKLFQGVLISPETLLHLRR